jgi:hypothetical protein
MKDKNIKVGYVFFEDLYLYASSMLEFHDTAWGGTACLREIFVREGTTEQTVGELHRKKSK